MASELKIKNMIPYDPNMIKSDGMIAIIAFKANGEWNYSLSHFEEDDDFEEGAWFDFATGDHIQDECISFIKIV